jgi:hypothetical protein
VPKKVNPRLSAIKEPPTANVAGRAPSAAVEERVTSAMDRFPDDGFFAGTVVTGAVVGGTVVGGSVEVGTVVGGIVVVGTVVVGAVVVGTVAGETSSVAVADELANPVVPR